MMLKLTLQVIEPSVFSPSETWCPPELIPSVPVMDGAFFKDFLMDEFSEEAWDFFNTEFGDILCDMISSISFPPKAKYFLSNAYDEFRKLALTEAKNTAKKYRAIYIFTDDEKNRELFRSELDLSDMMVKWVNNREDDCQSSIDVGQAMISGMEQFVASASWHYAWKYDGENKEPVMWFGLKGEKPEEGWILNLEGNSDTDFTWKDFWFSDNQWTNRVPDADSIFLTWMEAECAMYLPLLQNVLSICPIEVDEQDDYRTLSLKIANLL